MPENTKIGLTNNNIYDIIIIGAGASGLFCSASMGRPEPAKNYKGSGAESGRIPPRRLIVEKTGRAGTKLLMSGNGQCNITHGGSIKDFISCYGQNGNAIRSCLYKYNNRSLVDFLESGGIKTLTREDGKVFPASMDARDILNLLLQRTKNNGFELQYNSPVTDIRQHGRLWAAMANGQTYLTQNLIIATGGCSYPSTGSDGTMFNVLKQNLDISIAPLRPALSSIQVDHYPYNGLAGISFEKAQVSIIPSNHRRTSREINCNTSTEEDLRKTVSTEGGLLLTHNDLSGPAVLNQSKYAAPGDTLKINYLYPLTYDQVLNRLKAATHGAKGSASNLLAAEFNLPKRFCQLVTERVGASLKNLARLLTGEEFLISSVSGFNKAMATSGGINLSQVNTTTMEFRKYPGLFAIGEALDVDGITGGYNLQFAYASAQAAAAQITATPAATQAAKE